MTQWHWLCVVFVTAVIRLVAGVKVSLQNYDLTWVSVGLEWKLPIVLNGSSPALHYDGHGAVSAGATSRLLFDYEEPHRSRILDMLFLPRFGASLHQLKVEIGGDSQSGFGTEPSHMHRRNDISCNRGHEFWLIREARKRNPKIVIYGLSWAVPHWLGFHEGVQIGFYGEDLIDYHIGWLKCVREMGVGSVDFLGHRNEREWGLPEWTVQLRSSLDANGFNSTRLIIPDGDYDASIIEHAKKDASFAAALEGGGIGLHYPCALELRDVQEAGLKHVSSEDWYTQGFWGGAGCLGRLLNQNFVRMNVTATLAKYMLWSAYRNPQAPHESNSLLFAAEPWSGHHVVQPPVWAMAHTTHFTEVGWSILSTRNGQQQGSSGRLVEGGSYVTYVSPQMDHFTLVVEKLNGACDRCGEQATEDEDLTFCLVDGLERAMGARVGFWSTNSTHHLLHLMDLPVHSNIMEPGQHDPFLGPEANRNCFSFTARRDTIYTISNALYPMALPTHINMTNLTNSTEAISNVTASSGMPGAVPLAHLLIDAEAANVSNDSVKNTMATATQMSIDVDRNISGNISITPLGYQIPTSALFPRRHDDDFEAYHVNLSPRYFADYAGSWQVAEDPTRPSNKVLKQWVADQAHANQWAPDTDPIIFIGDQLDDVSVSAEMYLPPYRVPQSGIRQPSINIQSVWGALCLGVARQASWTGAAAEALPCSPDWHEQLVFDASSGSIMIPRTAKCLSSSGCPGKIGNPMRAELCFQDCCGAVGELASCAAGQSWQWGPDRALRPLSDTSTCVTVVVSGGQPVGSDGGFVGEFLRLRPCPDAQPNTRQQWTPTTTSFAYYGGICARISPPAFGTPERHKSRYGYCLNLGVDEMGRGAWQLEKDGAVVLARGIPDNPTGYWHRLTLDARGAWVTAVVDGWTPVTITDNAYSTGMVALNCGWGEAFFDNFTIGDADPDIMPV